MTASEENTPAAPGRFKRFIGIYLAGYFVLTVALITYRTTQYEIVPAQKWLKDAFPGMTKSTAPEADFLKALVPAAAHRRFWHGHSLSFRDAHGESVDIHEGQAINRLQAVAYARALLRSQAKQHLDVEEKDRDKTHENELFLHRQGWFANFPFETVLTLYNMFGLFLLLYLFLAEPLAAFLDTSAAEAAIALTRAEEAQEAAEILKQKYAQLVTEIEAEKKELDTRVVEDAAKEREEILAVAKHEAEQLLAMVKTGLEVEITHAKDVLRKEISRQALVQAETELTAAAGQAEHDNAFDSFLTDMKKVKLG